MEFHKIILMSLQIMNVLSKKYDSSSDESIENLLYFKDCQHNKKEEPTTPPAIVRLAAPSKPNAMDCPFPKMCCSLTCGNECGSSSPSMMGRQMDAMQMEQNFPPIGPMTGVSQPRQPAVVQPHAMQRNRKKKGKQPLRMQQMQLQPPIGGRRDFGFTKDRIKSLINQDDDIRKILKDLVRVTMKKVDLVDMINSKKTAGVPPPVMQRNSDTEDDDDDDELE